MNFSRLYWRTYGKLTYQSGISDILNITAISITGFLIITALNIS